MIRLFILISICAEGMLAFGSDSRVAPLADVAQHAVEQSTLALTGSEPFHLKARISETANPASEYKADLEEYWISPSKWRRTIVAPGFSQTLVVNGENILEEDKGDYFPWWLNDLVTAIFDPLPMLDQLKKVNAQIQKPSGGEQSTVCSRLQTRIGTPPAQNSAFLVFCFEGSHGLLESVVTPGYEVSFKDYKAFKSKRIARRYVTDPEPGTTIEARIEELSDFAPVNEVLFTSERSTPVNDRLRSVHLDEATLRSLAVATPDILWPTVRSGKTSGVLSMYVSVDRTGRVREAWPLNSDNAGLEDPAREQVKRWQFKPAAVDGAPVQVESTLTLAFNTKIGDPIPILTNEEARKLASTIVEPTFPPGIAPPGTEVKIQIGVALDGSVKGAGNPDNAPTQLFLAAYGAVRQWRFRPYLRDGKPGLFGADIVFRVP